MNIEELTKLIEQGESKTLEFKKSLAGLDSAGRALCGFLNQPEGGVVLIGVHDHGGKLTGQEVTDSVLKKIAGFLNRLQPAGRVGVEYIDLPDNEKKIILFGAQGLAHERPYSYDGKYYERIESTTQQLSHDQVRYLFLESSDAAKIWGEKTSERYSIDDLDFDEIKKVVRRGIEVNRVSAEAQGESIEDLMYRFKLMVEGKLTHSAIVLFAKDAEKFFPQCKIHLARFKGNDKYGEYIDNQLSWGNAFQTLRYAEDFIRKHHFIASRFQDDSFERIDEPTLPVAAVREAIINAICHRNYRERGTSIALAIYDDHMDIWNSGKLPPGWTLDKLTKKHNSEPRNELIAKVFYLQKFIESWGTGIQKIFEECKKANVPDPEYSEYSNGVAITFKYRESLIVRPGKVEELQVSDRQRAILDIISEQKSCSSTDILSRLSVSVTDRTLRSDLAELAEKGLVVKQGKGPSTVWLLAPKKSGNNPEIIRK